MPKVKSEVMLNNSFIKVILIIMMIIKYNNFRHLKGSLLEANNRGR